MHSGTKFFASLLVAALGCLLIRPYVKAQQPDATFRAQTEIVLVNVTVKDKHGNFVRDLKPEDFTVLEDKKPQKVLSFDTENIDAVRLPDVAQAKPLENLAAPANPNLSSTQSKTALEYKDRRLIIFFFDLSAMEPDEIDHALAAAQSYLDHQMQAADLVAIVTLGNSLQVNQDFTSDRTLLKNALDSLSTGAGQGFEEGSTGSTEGTPDTGGSFTADDTEFNIFNTDRRLEALRSVAEKLSHIQQKKSLIYFSNGMDRTGIENQSELRAAINAAVRANLALYTLDIRGLQAMVAGGEAQNASMRGTSPYSGQAMLSAYESNFTTQESLVTLASDTGGRAFLDSNDFNAIFKGVQDDTSFYYVLGYHSTNPARDGRYRRITVKLKRSDLKVEYRRGYYAPADYKHANNDDRELQLEEQLASEMPATDLPLYLGAAYFRLQPNKYAIPVSLVVPGSEIPFTRSSDRDKATLDVIGVVLDANQRPVTNIRDTVKLAVNTSAEVRRKNVQYNTTIVLPPGKFHVKFVVRENQTGRMGSFETDLNVPDLKSVPLKMSSVVLASQTQPANSKSKTPNPLAHDGSEIVQSVTHVFSNSQHLLLYYEIYDPARINERSRSREGGAGGIRLLSNVAFFQGAVKTYESSLVELFSLNVPNRQAAVFQLDVPLTLLKPGFYISQVNVIDDAGGHFVFPRLPLLIRPSTQERAAN
ncbi:MAG TPA: VWA domain-containing protein [Terriglobales bacterium]|nr:VWA domain-containing protein [Terriglobales bacterium]